MPQMWARCQPCDSWFFVPFDSGEQMSRARCPVCAGAAAEFHVRVTDFRHP
jgi:hypothetical protein